MKRNKFIYLLAALAAAAALTMTACGGKAQKTEEVKTEEEIKGTIQDAGKISALCPVGWKSVGLPDIKAADPAAMLTDGLRFVKGGASQKDINTNAYIDIQYYASDDDVKKIDPEEWYNDVVSIGEVVTGERKWEGYSASSMGKSFFYLKTSDKGPVFTAYLYTQDGSENSATIYNADVQAILESVSLSEKK